MAHPLISPSILAANFANLKHDVELINDSKADFLHIDIMDGVFVPNISFGFPVFQAIATVSKKPLDVHLMIVDPDRYIETVKNIGADIITVHYEACTHLHRTVSLIKEMGCRAGVALNPHTPVHLLQDIIGDLDMVLIMSVNPGFGGQKFIPNTFQKVRALRSMAVELNPSLIIEIDGGVTQENAPDLMKSGADMLVAGSFIFNSADPIETIFRLKDIDVSIYMV